MVYVVFDLVIFELVSLLNESAYELFKNGFFFPDSCIDFLDMFPIDLQKQVFWRLIASVEDLSVGRTFVELKSLTS